MDEGLGCADRRSVHHLEPGGEDAGADDVGDRCTRPLDVGEGREDDLRALGQGSSRTVTSTITPSMPSDPVMRARRS